MLTAGALGLVAAACDPRPTRHSLDELAERGQDASCPLLSARELEALVAQHYAIELPAMEVSSIGVPERRGLLCQFAPSTNFTATLTFAVTNVDGDVLLARLGAAVGEPEADALDRLREGVDAGFYVEPAGATGITHADGVAVTLAIGGPAGPGPFHPDAASTRRFLAALDERIRDRLND